MCCEHLPCARLRLFTDIIVLTLVLILTDSLVLQIRTLRCKNVSVFNLAWEKLANIQDPNSPTLTPELFSPKQK